MIIPFGIMMLILGLSLLVSDNRGEFENTIMTLGLLSGGLLIYGGYQTIKKAGQKEKAIIEYEKQVYQQIYSAQKTVATPVTNPEVEKNKSPKDGLTETIIPQETPPQTLPPETYQPDIIATWNYTPAEWKLMTKEETTRRLKEGIWVSLGIGLLGGWVLSLARGATFLIGFMVSLAVGIFISVLKVLLSNNFFKMSFDNKIIITTNALIINGKFKTIHDNDIHLQYIKPVKIKDDNFIEFSLEWLTRRGATNDQVRIYVPKAFEHEIKKILDYYEAKGVRTWE